jgi:hypothetical protein
MTKPPHNGGRLAGEPSPPPDDDHPWQRPTPWLTRCVEGTQACDERAWIAAAVRMVLANEGSAARFVRVVLFHLSSAHPRHRGHSFTCPKGRAW